MTFDISNRECYWFSKISEIPRASYHEKQISDFIVQFAKEHQLKYTQDEVWNVCVYKPASKGCETASPIILQGHIDMVPSKVPGSTHDFSKDPIEIYEENGFLKAKGTTLGADDGIAVAWMLSILEDTTLVHPPLECIFTVQEEVGLGGALHLKPSDIQADRLISLDSMGEGVADLCCAGGCYVECSKRFQTMNNTDPTYTLYIDGLKGGHSGADIHLERGNAIHILVRILQEIQCDVHLIDFTCDNAANVIPSNATVTFSSNVNKGTIELAIQASFQFIHEELISSDPDVSYTFAQVDTASTCADSTTTKDILDFIQLTPNGFGHRSMSIKGLTVTSLNLGTVKTAENTITMTWLLRSMFDSAVKEMCQKIEIAASRCNIQYSASSFFPGWQYSEVSKIRDKFAKAMEHQGKKLIVKAEHGGLEVGIFASLHPGLDITTIGANCTGFHSPQEQLDIQSFHNGMETLKDVLKQCTKD